MHSFRPIVTSLALLLNLATLPACEPEEVGKGLTLGIALASFAYTDADYVEVIEREDGLWQIGGTVQQDDETIVWTAMPIDQDGNVLGPERPLPEGWCAACDRGVAPR